MATSPSSASLGGTPHAVEFGAAMRDMRLAHNADLATVAANLRIRQVYLQAIEEGRFDELPGPTYASGFVRAYAEYLGLDMGEVMRRYREVTRGGGAQTPLVAPSPVSEGRMPTGFVLLVAAVLAAAAYGSWYYLTLHDRDASEIVASLPQRIADMVGLSQSADKTAAPPATTAPPPAGPPQAATTVPKAEAPPSPVPADRTPAAPTAGRAVSKPTPPTQVETAPPPQVEPSPPQPAARESVAVESLPPPAVEPAPVEREAPSQTGTVSRPSAPAAEAASPPSTTDEPATTRGEMAAPQPAVPMDAPSSSPTPEGAPEVAAAPPAPAPAPAPQSVASAPAEPGRVVLRATAISWVELRDAEGRRVFSRLLKKGETYNVPPQPGITLATGNAGAIDILVDGQAVAPIGPVGAVRRDVLLEPDALRRAGAPGQ